VRYHVNYKFVETGQHPSSVLQLLLVKHQLMALFQFCTSSLLLPSQMLSIYGICTNYNKIIALHKVDQL